MRVLVLTNLFPNVKQPLFGIFVKKRIMNLAKFCEVKVVAPVPWTPFSGFLSGRYGAYSGVAKQEIQDGIEVFHPKYLVTPKIGRSLHGFMYFFSLVRFMKKLEREYSFDILDVHWGYPDGFAGVLLAGLLNKPVAVTVRGTDINEYPKYFLRRRQIVYALNRANLVIAVCKALKDAVVDLGIPEPKVKVISNGVSPSEFFPVEKQEARRELGLPLDKKIVLSVGHLIPRKGFHYVIDAMHEIIKRRGDVFLAIVGEGEYRKNLESQIRRLNLNGSVKLFGSKPNEELYKWYSASDVFCLASSREGWANVILEAYACGIPVVATKIWGTPEVVCSEGYGILVEKQDGKLLAEALLESLEREWDTDKILSYARENTWGKVGEGVFAQFSSFLEGDAGKKYSGRLQRYA